MPFRPSRLELVGIRMAVESASNGDVSESLQCVRDARILAEMLAGLFDGCNTLYSDDDVDDCC